MSEKIDEFGLLDHKDRLRKRSPRLTGKFETGS